MDLLELITSIGVPTALPAMGYSTNYGYKLLSGDRPVTRDVLAAASRAFGARLDIPATWRATHPDWTEQRVHAESVAVLAMSAIPREESTAVGR